jgi:hypothetical protein
VYLFFHSCMYVAGELSTRPPVDKNATYMRGRAGNLPVRRARIYTQTPGGRAPVYLRSSTWDALEKRAHAFDMSRCRACLSFW